MDISMEEFKFSNKDFEIELSNNKISSFKIIKKRFNINFDSSYKIYNNNNNYDNNSNNGIKTSECVTTKIVRD